MISSLLQPTFSLDDKKYKVVQQIAEGGFGFVYQVRCVSRGDRNQLFALKKMICQIPEQVAEVQKEVRVLGAIDHPNVIRLLSSSSVVNKRAQEEHLLLFPLYNCSVQSVIDAGPGPPCCSFADGLEVVHIVRQALAGLRAVHDVGYRHSDFKPANILLSPGREAVLTDMGSASPLVQRVESRHAALRIVDAAASATTASYRAPELFDCPSNCELDGKSDVWSAGCLLFSLFYSRTPFETPMEGLSVLSIMSGHYTLPSTGHEHGSSSTDLATGSGTGSGASSAPVVAWPVDYLSTLAGCLTVDPTGRLSLDELQLRVRCWTLPPLDFAAPSTPDLGTVNMATNQWECGGNGRTVYHAREPLSLSIYRGVSYGINPQLP